MTTRTPVPAVEGWFTVPEPGSDEPPTLLGGRCTDCGTYVFPRASSFCPNPACEGTDFDQVPLSRTGTVWSYTDAQYQPPPPYVVPGETFEPFALAAVELAAEGLVVMGQLVPGVGVDDVAVGDQVELVLGTLFSDDDHDHLVWRWQPTARPADDRGGAR
jgi:uncharacterized OB-fold protein